jgi:fructose-1,6-bisphosphatase II
MFDAGPIAYMHKIAVGEVGRDAIDINDSIENNLKNIARAKGGNVNDLLVVVLDRPRHEPMIEEIRAAGARITLIPDGDVAGAIMTGLAESGIDVLMGIGGCPEGVLAACAMRSMGGNIQGKLFARTVEEYKTGLELGYDFDKVLTMDDLVRSEDVFFAATGITTGAFLKGIDYFPGGATTESLVIRGRSGTMRKIISTHRLTKLDEISGIKY